MGCPLGHKAIKVLNRSFNEFLHEGDLEVARSRFEMNASGPDLEPKTALAPVFSFFIEDPGGYTLEFQ